MHRFRAYVSIQENRGFCSATRGTVLKMGII